MTAEKWDAFTRRQPGQNSLVVANFARARGMPERIEVTKNVVISPLEGWARRRPPRLRPAP
jgi:hypothetical protein